MKAGHWIAGIAVLGAAMLPAVALAKHGTTDNRAYVGPAPVFGMSSTGEVDPPNVGFAEFSVGDADEVTITIDDASGLTTSGVAFVFNGTDDTVREDPPDGDDLDPRTGDEDLLAQDAFCGSSQTFTLTEEATRVEVFVGPIDATTAALYYGEEPPVCPGPGTTGEIVAEWG